MQREEIRCGDIKVTVTKNESAQAISIVTHVPGLTDRSVTIIVNKDGDGKLVYKTSTWAEQHKGYY